MKLIHTSDLHLGRRLGEFSLIDDQRAMLQQLLDLIRTEAPDALLVSGDIYDKTVPSAEAVALFDDFLTAAAELTQILMIAGNHDSPERISFGGRLMERSGVHVCGVYDGETHCVTLTDAWGDVNVYLLPFIRPADVRRYFPDADTDSYNSAYGTAVRALGIDSSRRNVILTHQFITGGVRSESETVSVGGTDAVDIAHLSQFDYAALGHLHRAQTCKTEERDGIVRYSGSPIAYSVSEADDEKSVTVVTLCEKGNCTVDVRPLTPHRNIVRLRGAYDEVMALEFYRDTDYKDAFVQMTLTDEADVPDALYRLRTVYPYLLRLEYDNTRTRADQTMELLPDAADMDPETLFSAFYRMQNGTDMEEDMASYLRQMIACLWREEENR